jgi:CheY-like chemotaxis protein
LRAQIESTAQDIENQFSKKKLSFSKVLDPNIPNTLVGDPEKVELIIRHLLHNAFKFTKNGEVNLEVKVAERDNNKVALHFQISDTGPGMSKKEVDRLSQAFTQGDEGNTREHGGTGLGLNLSTRLAELMGGELYLDSKPGKGTEATFTLTLLVPRMNLSRETEYLREDHHQLDPALKILYAEDNPVNQKLLTMMLKNMGYEVDLAQNGKEAVKMAAQKTYHIIFMDVQMPEMDGIEATRQIIKEEHHRPIIIAVTANADVADQKRCLEAGMNDFIAKPFNAKSLKEGLIKWQGLRRYLDGDNEQRFFQNIS